jgi:hypothetical protein
VQVMGITARCSVYVVLHAAEIPSAVATLFRHAAEKSYPHIERRYPRPLTPPCRHSPSVSAVLKAAIMVRSIGEGRSALLVVASVIWLVNIGFGLWRGFHDAVNGKRGQAAVGIACVVGVNAVLGWMIYTAVSSSTDL